MLCNVLAVFQLCSPLVLKQVGTPCWQWWWWQTHKGTGATMGAMLGSKGHDMRRAERHAACGMHGHPPANKEMSSISTAPCIFFCLPEARVDLPGCDRLQGRPMKVSLELFPLLFIQFILPQFFLPVYKILTLPKFHLPNSSIYGPIFIISNIIHFLRE